MKFTKMHGIGNDYVYVNCFEETIKDPSAVAKFVSDRHCGRIFDSLLKTVYIYIIVSNAVHFREFHNDNLLLFLNIILGFSVGAQDPHGKNTPVFSSCCL